MFSDSPYTVNTEAINTTGVAQGEVIPDNLAQRVQYFRARRSWTLQQLSERINEPLNRLEDIEEGKETVLSSILRRKLAQAFHIAPIVLQEVELLTTQPEFFTDGDSPADSKTLTEARLEAMRDNPTHTWPCPSCNAPLTLRPFQRQDMTGTPIEVLKVNCLRCLFRHEAEWINWHR